MSRALPILFNTDMVREILDGRKTVTRRLIKPQPKFRLCYTFAGCNYGTWSYPNDTAHEFWGEDYKLPDCITNDDKQMVWKPPYNADDILYVRETFYMDDSCILYKADNPNLSGYRNANGEDIAIKWRPSIHMPREAARIWLRVKDVRVERLQDITAVSALNEGAQRYIHLDGSLDEQGTKTEFIGIWNSTIKKSDLDCYGWDANPWVWVIEFERREKLEGC